VTPHSPRLVLESEADTREWPCVAVHDLPADLIGSLRVRPDLDRVLKSALRVRVAGAADADHDLPDTFGRHQLIAGGIRFSPHFPFEPGVTFQAAFDPSCLGGGERLHVMTLEFCLPRDASPERTRVMSIFPSDDALPENLLRFYVCFSHPMQRGYARQRISLLDSDGRPAADLLYRAPVELWDSGMTCLTVLLDPGRIKRGLGPHRVLGPPLRTGERYTLAVGPQMRDSWGRPLADGFSKTFRVTEAVREPISIRCWDVLAPAMNSRQPLQIIFPKPLDRALLARSLTVRSGDRTLEGRIRIDQSEKRWSFVPRLSWAPGTHSIRVAPGLEDVCGNRASGAFDRPVRSADDLTAEVKRLPDTLLFTPVAVTGGQAMSVTG
jgi:hypothetical protein